MGARHSSRARRIATAAPAALASFTILLALLMFVPIHTALSAGIAALSLVIFFVCFMLLAFTLRGKRLVKQPLLLIGLGAAVLGMVIPQAAYLAVAQRHGAQLTFDPVSYTYFSGQTALGPTKIIRYNQHNNLAYYPADVAGIRPVVVLVHGGGWRYGDYLETGPWPSLLTRAGYAVVSIDYRLSSDTYHSWHDAPSDIHEALRYLEDHANDLSIDPQSIHLLGQSAGGHLALLEAYRYNQVRSVISLYAPVDLVLDYQTSRDASAELNLIGGTPSEYPDRYRSLSPLHSVTSAAPPSLLIQGERDDLVAAQNALILAQALDRHGVPRDVLLLPLTGHSFENQQGGFATQLAAYKVIDFLERY